MTFPAIAPLHRTGRWAVLTLIVAAQFMVVLDMSIVNVALAAIKSDLHFSAAGLQWVISGYALTFGGFLLLGGRLADLLGRRRLFIGGLALFTVASALCGIAWSPVTLIVFRALQGIGGALFAPAGLSLLMTSFPEGAQRNRALGIWGAASGSGAAVGVLLGGLLTSALNWPWVFYINVPVGIAVVLLAPRMISESRADGLGRHFDVAGASTITASTMLLVFALTKATTDGWSSALTVSSLVASAALAGLFLAIERRAPSPLLPLAAFRGTTLGVGTFITSVIASVGFAQFFLLTLYVQQVLHYSAMQAGAAFTAIAVGVAVTSNLAQRFVGSFGARPVLGVGLLLMTASQALYLRLPVDGHYVTDLLPSFVLMGLGLGTSFVAVTIASLAGTRPQHAGVASGLVNTSRQIGGAIGLAVAATIASTVAGHSPSLAATVHGDHVAFAVLTVLALAAAGLAPMLRPHREHAAPRVDLPLALKEAA
ncbi:MAG TPA: DHA2 family efflux MFS transporter permease subunit [Gaiellaceae bacterium]|nr:DHA2 family efflux MFS transporter permease subunit [Gaiellaceae bacterium]